MVRAAGRGTHNPGNRAAAQPGAAGIRPGCHPVGHPGSKPDWQPDARAVHGTDANPFRQPNPGPRDEPTGNRGGRHG
jgi:hypothetical protein